MAFSMYEFASHRQDPKAFPLQIVAVRFEGGGELHHIVEHLLYDHWSGKVERRPRGWVLDWIKANGAGSVITRDPRGTAVYVVPERVEGRMWLRTRPDGEFEDNLYSLYPFETPGGGANSFHTVSIRYAGERRPSLIEDFIVYSDASGSAERLSRGDLAQRIAAAPGSYIVETPCIRRTALRVEGYPLAPLVLTGGAAEGGEDLLFRLPRHEGCVLDLI